MTKFEQIATKIIREQELIIGPIAWSEASKVRGIHIISQGDGTLNFEGENSKSIIDELVIQYERLFGRASREVCKEAVASIIADLPLSEIPYSLR